MTKSKEKAIPKWFKGTVYTKGGKVTNSFSGHSYELTAIELSMYDFIMGSQMMFEYAPKIVSQQQINDFHRGLTWFRSANIDAYYVLLD